MQMIMGSNKRWSDLTAGQKAHLVVQEIVQMTLLVAASRTSTVARRRSSKAASGCGVLRHSLTSWASVRSSTSPSGRSMPNDSPSERRISYDVPFSKVVKRHPLLLVTRPCRYRR
jgi:hypothetical protein